MAFDDLGCPDTRFGAAAHTREEGLHVLESLLTCDRCIDYLSQEPAPATPIRGRAEMRLVK